MPANDYNTPSGPGRFLKWAGIALAALVICYLLFYFLVGKAVVSTVTG